MKADRLSFAVGVMTLALAALALWSAAGRLNVHLLQVIVPIALVATGIGVLLLSRSDS